MYICNMNKFISVRTFYFLTCLFVLYSLLTAVSEVGTLFIFVNKLPKKVINVESSFLFFISFLNNCDDVALYYIIIRIYGLIYKFEIITLFHIIYGIIFFLYIRKKKFTLPKSRHNLL